MVHPHDTLGVDQDVATLLHRVSSGYSGKPPLPGLAPVRRHGCPAPQVTPPGAPHSVGAIQAPVRIDEDRPGRIGLFDILPRRLLALKRDQQGMHIEPIQGWLRVPQLQHVSAAGQSIQMPMHHQQQPPAPVVFKSVFVTAGVEQLEGCGGTSNHAHHRAGVSTVPPAQGAWDAARIGFMTVGVVTRGDRRLPGSRCYCWTNLCSAGLTVSATQMSPFGATVM